MYPTNRNMGNKPVNFVNLYDAARFANWMHNGQGTVYQTGAYTLNGNAGILGRNPDATFWIPNATTTRARPST